MVKCPVVDGWEEIAQGILFPTPLDFFMLIQACLLPSLPSFGRAMLVSQILQVGRRWQERAMVASAGL